MNKAAEIRQRLDELLLTHYHKLDTPGIFKGKMGACLYFFQAFHHQNDPRFGTAAESTLQEVYSFVHQNPVPSYFDNGLAGIAWGIHQLIKNGSLEGEADELLEQIDNILFKVISEKSEEIEFGVKRGLLGYLLYIFDRLAELSDIRDFHISRELFTSLATLLVNRIHLMVAYGKASFAEPNGFHVFWDLPNYLYVLAEAVKVGLLPNKINRMIKDITPVVLSTIPQNPGNSLNLYWSMRRLSVPDWENHTGILLNHLIEAPLSGFNLRNREAQAMQLPVLATLHNGIPEGVKDGISGYLVPERDIDQMAIKMKKLIDHPTIREEMGKQGRAFVMEKFDNNKLGKKLEEIYINLITMQ